MVFHRPNIPLPTHFVPDGDAQSIFVARQPLLKYWGSCYMVQILMSWVDRRDGKSLFDFDLQRVMIRACLELPEKVDTVVLADFGDAEHAMCVALGFQVLE